MLSLLLSLLDWGWAVVVVEEGLRALLGFWLSVAGVEEGGRQKSSKTSASRGACMWM